MENTRRDFFKRLLSCFGIASAAALAGTPVPAVIAPAVPSPEIVPAAAVSRITAQQQAIINAFRANIYQDERMFSCEDEPVYDLNYDCTVAPGFQEGARS